MSAHTPGPWRYIDRQVLEDGGIYPMHIVGGDFESQICLIESPMWAEVAHKQPDLYPIQAVTQANTRLIAAAPAMLAALELVAKWADDNGRTFKLSVASDSETAQAIAAAIRAAKGEA